MPKSASRAVREGGRSYARASSRGETRRARMGSHHARSHTFLRRMDNRRTSNSKACTNKGRAKHAQETSTHTQHNKQAKHAQQTACTTHKHAQATSTHKEHSEHKKHEEHKEPARKATTTIAYHPWLASPWRGHPPPSAAHLTAADNLPLAPPPPTHDPRVPYTAPPGLPPPAEDASCP